jgi:hypothetical protein
MAKCYAFLQCLLIYNKETHENAHVIEENVLAVLLYKYEHKLEYKYKFQYKSGVLTAVVQQVEMHGLSPKGMGKVAILMSEQRF